MLNDDKVILVDKPIGLTPLDAIKVLKKNSQAYKSHKKMGYAGRLDPQASGLLLVLVGEENKSRKKYEMLEKEYEFEVLFGVSSDTFDVMGLVDKACCKFPKLEDIEYFLRSVERDFQQPYPPYSSARVDGHPLYWWARENRLGEIKIPTKQVKINRFEVVGSRKAKGEKLISEVKKRLLMVKGDFRQKEIVSSWEENLQNCEYKIVKFVLSGSSGLYVRSIAKSMGESMAIPSLAYSIKRIRIGQYFLSDSIRI